VKNFYVTTPIYYVNDVPHIGHAYTTMLADVLARYHRLLGEPTFFLTGTDEHGQKVYEAAREAGISAKEQADRTVVRFLDAWKRLEITYDDFIRTTEPRHTEVVREILQDLYDRGEIYRGEYEGWYSVSDERFYTERELVDGKSPEGKPVERVVETNYFFRMSAYRDWLVEYIEADPSFIQPDFRRNETLGFLRRPLGDLCISRPKSRLPWGVELPWDRDYVCYVWFDALVNYISAIGYRRDEARFKEWWPVRYHLIGKDILTTHTVYWPTMLKAMGVEMPKTIFAHGWWLVGGEKMSKSVGNVTDPLDLIDQYGVDALRYYLMAEMTLGQDATFTVESFVTRYNADLANDLGNLASRVLRMIERNLDGRIPAPVPGEQSADDEVLRSATLAAVQAMESHVHAMQLDRGIARVIEAVREANRYFDRTAPWALVKEGKGDRLATVIYTTSECLRIVSGLLFPVIPAKMGELRRALGLREDEIEPHLAMLREWGRLEPGRTVGHLEALFPRIERPDGGVARRRVESATPSERATGSGSAAPSESLAASNAADGLIDIDEFARAKLKVATVIEAERVPGADRLLRLRIDLGDHTRQIVAGIATAYSPEAILGKRIVVVTNLKPARIRGIESNGMLLAAKDGKRFRIVTVDADVPPGSEVG
jgi:methionyl-tRNA synthetase